MPGPGIRRGGRRREARREETHQGPWVPTSGHAPRGAWVLCFPAGHIVVGAAPMEGSSDMPALTWWLQRVSQRGHVFPDDCILRQPLLSADVQTSDLGRGLGS